ncbi:NAD(P)-dependent dehydrogenase (short-subunit alcohol dehydrogenase family) [Kribbella steppae]|uniref:NAD(P)-dependent dehydrogenase (Short-subunit alcohol dehydrogenase family) n=1 Tax=Kribbella steppae TaxID=2512223 RepID=A0A4R2HUL1_9ACTN|nr:SDR family oxidoreductase [Kribbella steppae]TCO35131.1 NAD(P)-dependent dehydrogenase (short-subunit alcohol dehydrogenase family) [Kribbella steppae]
MTLQDQRVVILGGTSGIGLATAQLAADQGATVIVASSNPESVKRALESLPSSASGKALDLTDAEAVTAFFDGLEPFDHLVFTAGESLTLLAVASMDLARARQAFEVRYFGALGAVSAAASKIRPGGSVVLTTGAAADRPGPGWSVAAGICGAVDSLVRALAVELAPIRVNAVKPGMVRTPLWSDLAPEALYEETAKVLPVGRVGEPSDIAAAYVYLMDQGYATGTIVSVDGGHVLV